MTTRNILTDNRGAFIVFVALFLLLILLFVAVSIEVGWTTFVRNQGQARVDAAALAGASAILEGEAKVRNRANTFGDQNAIANLSLDPDDSVIEPMLYNPLATPVLSPAPGPDPWTTCNAVRVSTTIPTPLFFNRLLNGGDPMTLINVSAAAVIPRKPDLPVTLLRCNSGPTTLEITQTPSPSDNSAFTTFTVSSANANDLRDMVNNPQATIPAVKEGDCINVTNGQATTVLQEMLKTYSPFTPPVCFLVPVTPTSGNPVQCQVITQFAQICVSGVNDKGSPKTITAEVTCGVTLFGTGSGVLAPPILIR